MHRRVAPVHDWTMKIGLSIGDFTWPSGPAELGSTLGKIARTADQAGFDSIWVMDHFWQIRMNGPEHHDMLEGYSALAYMAAVTSRAKLAQACNLFPTPELPHKLEVLREHCKTVGRNYDEIEKTAMFQFDVGENGENVGKVIGGLRWLAGMGIETAIGNVPKLYDTRRLDIIGEKVIPAVASLEPATV